MHSHNKNRYGGLFHQHYEYYFDKWLNAAHSDNGRFLWLTLCVFCLMLGGAGLLLALVEYVFFALSFGRLVALVVALALVAGGGGLLHLLRPHKIE